MLGPMPPAPVPASRRTTLRRVLAGAHPALPGPVDGLAERWAGLPPRGRAVLTLVLLLAVAVGVEARVHAAEHRWGGAPVSVLVAAEDLPVGAAPTAVRRALLPPGALPWRPLAEVPDGAVLTLALPRGAVLTESHVAPSGPAAGLGEGLRALPVPVDEGWGVTAGGWVDVWVLGGDAGATLAARSRPVLELRGEPPDISALLGLAIEEVTAVTAALSHGRVLLAHAPPPGG
jgi:hypothetical protein